MVFIRRWLRLVFILACALALSLAFRDFYERLIHIQVGFPDGWAWDFAINLTAAKALRLGISLYDNEAMRALGQSAVAPGLARGFSVPFNSYISLPSSALLFLPFTLWPLSTSTAIYRFVLLFAFAASIFIAGFALPKKDRCKGWLVGTCALLTFGSVTISIEAGQVDAWVMVAMAISLWAARQRRWGIMGIGIALAVLLKISPVIILVYCLLKGRWRAAIAAGLTIALALGIAAFLGQPRDLLVFGFKVLPSLSDATLHVENQSFAAWLARVFVTEVNFDDFRIGLGSFRLVSPIVAISGLAIVWYLTRRQELQPLGIGVLVLIALLTGPITWEHYTTWAILPLMQMMDSRLWNGWSREWRINLLTLLFLGGLLFRNPAWGYTSAAVASNWSLRLSTGICMLAVLIWSGVGLLLLWVKSNEVERSIEVPVKETNLEWDGAATH